MQFRLAGPLAQTVVLTNSLQFKQAQLKEHMILFFAGHGGSAESVCGGTTRAPRTEPRAVDAQLPLLKAASAVEIVANPSYCLRAAQIKFEQAEYNRHRRLEKQISKEYMNTSFRKIMRPP